MSVLRYVLVAVAACFGVVCIVAGLHWRSPPVRGSEEGMYHALGDAWGQMLAWPTMILGALLVLGAVVGLGLGLRRLIRDARSGADVAPTSAPLPEARAHFTPRDERNGK